MQRPDERKRQKIVEIAARLFAAKPFHEVKLDDVAAAAEVGKGTLYIYFKSKEDLYFSLVQDGMARFLDQLRQDIGENIPPREALERAVRGTVASAYRHPAMFELIRAIGPGGHPGLRKMRAELAGLIEAVLRRGMREGIWHDPHPELTALFIPGFVRSAMVHGPGDIDEEVLVGQIMRLLRTGLAERENG